LLEKVLDLTNSRSLKTHFYIFLNDMPLFPVICDPQWLGERLDPVSISEQLPQRKAVES